MPAKQNVDRIGWAAGRVGLAKLNPMYEEVYLHAYETVSAAHEGINRYIVGPANSLQPA